MSFKFQTENEHATRQAAQQLASLLPDACWIRLDGELGAGKTTFTQGLGKALGIQRAIKSPTYTIIKEYPLQEKRKFVHIDAYRLEESGADTVDVDLYRHDNVVVIEWAQYIEESLPESYLHIQIRYIEASAREFSVNVVGKDEMLMNLCEQWQQEIQKGS